MNSTKKEKCRFRIRFKVGYQVLMGLGHGYALYKEDPAKLGGPYARHQNFPLRLLHRGRVWVEYEGLEK